MAIARANQNSVDDGIDLDEASIAAAAWEAADYLETGKAPQPFPSIALGVFEATPYEVATALMHELGRHAPSVLVLEDVHWAAEATLEEKRAHARTVARFHKED